MPEDIAGGLSSKVKWVKNSNSKNGTVRKEANQKKFQGIFERLWKSMPGAPQTWVSFLHWSPYWSSGQYRNHVGHSCHILMWNLDLSGKYDTGKKIIIRNTNEQKFFEHRLWAKAC